MGGKGLFVKEIEDALLRGEAEVAVHSMKDLPAELAPGLTMGAVPEREDPARRPVRAPARPLRRPPAGRAGGHLQPPPRRPAPRPPARPAIEMVRGNVETRLRRASRRARRGGAGHAGLRRLGLAEHVTYLFPVEEMLPAVAQGALAIEARADDASLRWRGSAPSSTP